MAQLVQVSQVPQMAEMDMLYSMGPAASVPTVHFVLMIFLQLFMRVGHHSHKLGAAAIGNCSNPCRITMEVLKLWRVTSPSGLHRVPVPKAMSFLSFNGNSLSKLQEGSLSRTHRDLSSNAIQTIEMNSREAVPFVQLIDLSGNLIEKLTPGAFEAWHGMQFLLKMVLNHHPLKVIDDASFYRLPSLKLLNLSSTEMTPKILEDLLQTSQQLKTLILPNKIFCCLCRMKDDIEVLSDTIKLDCTDTCTTKETLCEKDEALNRMQKEVMKALEIRKLNASSTLNILPEKLLHSNITMKVTVRQRNTNLGELNPHLLKSVQELEKDEALNRMQKEVMKTLEIRKLNVSSTLNIVPEKPLHSNITMKVTVRQRNTNLEKDEALNRMQKEVMKALEIRKLNASSTLNILPEKLLHSNLTMKVTVRQRNTNLGELNPHLLKSVQELEKDEALNRMQKEVMKALEIRKLNASSTLNIVPEKLLHSNITMKVTVRQRNTNLGELNPHLLKSVQELGKLKPKEVLQIKWNDTSELKKLYMLANLLQMALTEQVMEDKRGRQGEPRQIARRSAWKWSVMQFTTSFPFLTASIMVDNDAADLTGRVLIILKHFNESSHQDHSLHEEETAAPSTTTTTTTTPTTTPTTTTTTTTSTTSPTSQSLLLEGTSGSSQNEPSEGNSEQTSDNAPLMAKEALLNQLMHGTQEGGVPQIPGDNAEAPQIPGDDTEASLNEISPDITLSHETHWEHHELKTTARHKLNILPTDDDYLLQGDLFEAELNKRLSPLIPNTPVRNLISHTLRILKMDCTVSRVQLACAKLISRTGLLMKLFSERENLMDNSALWKSYFLSMKNVSNLATGSPRKMGKSEIGSQGIPEYGYGKKLLFAISVTAVIIIIISVIGLTEICSQCSAAKHGTPQEKRTFLGRKKKGAEQSSSAGSSVLDKPLWLKDMYQPLDEVRKKSMVDKMHDEESSEDEDIFSWARVPGAPPGPPSPSPVEQPPARRPSSRKMSQMTAPSPARKPSSKTLSAHPSLFAPQSAPPSVPPSIPMYMSPYVPPSATPSIHPYVPPSVSPSIHQSVPPSEYQSVPPSAPHSARPSVHQSAPPSAPPSAPHSAPHSARPSVPASVEGAPHTPSPKSSLTKPPSEASKRGSTAEGGTSTESKKASSGAGSQAGGSKAEGSESGGSATEED
ncbi:uncharacterized protein LOC128329273 isoform X4 [Hemicordylus capensis]|uniref:uncharacterized protein LOC128329273 isoform X4 n=1 Tax=Hemicordylus capensis TaxID=884348 RepID=UPI0023026E2F|nr:uncharacterized protein LOC128329273 isoform X4 [Hemicordylus capensis]